MPSTPSQEDYLEAIWELIEEKGYARVTDIADRLGISRASVSRMVRKLNANGQLIYERYRGLNLTRNGRRKGQSLHERHQTLVSFLTTLGFDDAPRLDQTVEGIEHFFGPDELRRISRFLCFWETNPAVGEAWMAWQTAHPVAGSVECLKDVDGHHGDHEEHIQPEEPD
jgi:DtxR family manganese transport transcriptional regulator